MIFRNENVISQQSNHPKCGIISTKSQLFLTDRFSKKPYRKNCDGKSQATELIAGDFFSGH